MQSDPSLQNVEWSAGFSVNLEFLDNHHKKFLDLLNSVKDTIRNQACVQDLSIIFIRLIYYTENFFVEEEIYFQQLDYPNFRQHKDHHNEFIAKVKALQDAYSAGKEGVCRDLLFLLENFFQMHILGYDREAVNFLQGKGVR